MYAKSVLHTIHFAVSLLALITHLPTNPSPASALPTPEPIFKTDLVRRMLLGIFGGQWKTGDRLREEVLAGHFQVSRTPVREALQELAALGLVELRPNCGALVAPFGPREVEEMYEIRALLESEATRLAGPRMAVEELQRLDEDLAELLESPSHFTGWSQRAWDADRSLHGLVAARCPNRRLAGEIARYSTFVQIIRETVGNRGHAQVDALREHRAVVGPLLRRSPVKAAAAMHTHISEAGRTAVKAIQEILKPIKRSTLR